MKTIKLGRKTYLKIILRLIRMMNNPTMAYEWREQTKKYLLELVKENNLHDIASLEEEIKSELGL